MNTLKDIERIVTQCGWDISKIEIESQPMGATNTSYRCCYCGEQYVVRLGSSCPELLAINRQAEEAALEEKQHLLELYFGESRPELLQKLCDFSVVNWMWNGTWAYLKSCEVPPEQFDYIDFGHRHIDMILRYKREHPVQ